MFTPEIQKTLGQAVIFVGCGEDEVAIIGNSHWILLVPINELSEQVHEALLRYGNPENGKYVDYRILTTEDVDIEGGVFFPALSKRVERIEMSWPGDTMSSVTSEVVYDLFYGNDESLQEDVYNLTEMLSEGKARPVYEDWDDAKGQRPIAVSRSVTGPYGRTQGGHPHKFLFEFDNKVIAIGGAYLKGFAAIGAQLSISRNYEPHATRDPIRGAGNLPLVGIRISDTIMGLLAPIDNTGTRETADGRPLYRDAGAICWKSVDYAMSLIDSDTSLFDPRKVDQYETDIDTQVESVGTWTTVAEAVGILRWRGAEEKEIADLLSKRRYDAWCKLYNCALSEAQRIVDADLKNLAVSLENKGPAAAKWQVNSLRNRVEGLCHHVEELSNLMELLGGDGGGDRDIGLLPELVDSIRTLETACGS